MEEIILLQDYKKTFYMKPKINAQNIWKTVLLNNSSGVTYKLTPESENGTILITGEKKDGKVEYYVRDAKAATQQARNEVIEEREKREKQKRLKAIAGASVVAAGQIGKKMLTGSGSSSLAGHSVEKTYNSLLSENAVSDHVISEFLYVNESVSYAHYRYPLLYLCSRFNDNNVVQKGVPPQFYLPIEKNHCITIERKDVFDFHIFEFWSEKDADAVLNRIIDLMK